MTDAPRSRFAPWLMLAPFLAVFAVFVAWPLATSVVLSTRQTFGPGTSRGVGWGNFEQLFADPLFWRALRNTGLYTVGTVLVQLPLSMLLALALNHPRLRGRAFFRMIIFSPVLVGVVFVAMIFTVLFDKRTGLINQVLHAAIGWDLDFPWLDTYVIPSLIVATLWQYVGYNMVYFLAALQNVSPEMREAALLDGAGPWSRFRHVVIPAIRPVATFVVLLAILGSFQLFELPFILLNGTSGPDNRGLTLVMYLYQTGFQTGDLGYASAIGWALALVLGVFAVVQYSLDRRGVRR
ncbi:MAG: sugar ABC transporter permease [Planctomycetota bacterium]|nr:sugar ABC transporter permease [Planctomycetota bacterium]